MPTQVNWRARFGAALTAAEQRRTQASRVACGFTNNVDVVLNVDEDARQVLRAVEPRGPIGHLPTRIDHPADVVNCLLHHMRAGTGDVLTIGPASVAEWMQDNFRGPLQLGGTGAQAANTLACLGYEPLLHVASLSAVDVAVFDGADRIVVAAEDGLRPLAEAIDVQARPQYHYVFEYQTGDRLDLWGTTVTATRANRIILEFDSVNRVLPIHPAFIEAIAEPSSRVSRVLLSGYTQVEDGPMACERIATTIGHLRYLRQVRPDLVFHLELASVNHSDLTRPIIEDMASQVESLGLNEQEIVLVADTWGWARPQGVADQLETLSRIRRRTGARRVNLHSQEYCLTLTDYDPHTERDALLFASLVAGTRARLAKFPTMHDLGNTLAEGQPGTGALVVEEQLREMLGLDEGIGRYDNVWLVFAPTLSVSHPRGTVGLGDSFTGGILVFLGGTEVPPAGSKGVRRISKA